MENGHTTNAAERVQQSKRALRHELAEGALFTDQYQLTMAQLYFERDLHERPAQFDHFFRNNPDYGSHQAGFCVAAGLEWLLDWIDAARFTEAVLAPLRAQVDASGAPVFSDSFCNWLADIGSFESLSIEAVPEGRVVHPGAPMTVVRGPLAVAQLLETALLNQLNFQTLIATKASRVAEASRGRPVLEFGLRRSAEFGANAATRAALVGGAEASSNVGASYLMGLNPRGTHAHSMVQAFMALGEGELGAFRAYADSYPDGCLLLVDTIDTLGSGVPNAITVFEELRAKGHEPVGIRLDSGDLAYLAIQSALQLDAAGFDDVGIVLSSSLDELLIFQILAQIDSEAPRYGLDPARLVARLSMGVGSKLTASEGHPYLDGVYKLVSIEQDGESKPAIKVSDTPAKTPNPGDKSLYRIYDARGRSTADLLTIADADAPSGDAEIELRHPTQPNTRRRLAPDDVSEIEPLLTDVVVDGSRVAEPAPLDELRARRVRDIERLDPGVRRLVNPHRYHVSLSTDLFDLKQSLVETALRG